LVGTAVTFTSQVTPQVGSGAVPTGTVSYYDAASLLGTVNLNGGTAIFTTSSLGIGSHAITALYSGDSNYASSQHSNAQLVTAYQKLPVSITVSASLSSCVVGQGIVLTATVSPSSATGFVSFYSGTTFLGSATLVNGIASISTTFSTSGSVVITAIYSGDTNYMSTSTQTTITVNGTGGTPYAPSPATWAWTYTPSPSPPYTPAPSPSPYPSPSPSPATWGWTTPASTATTTTTTPTTTPAGPPVPSTSNGWTWGPATPGGRR